MDPIRARGASHLVQPRLPASQALSLAARFPAVAAEWHPTRNDGVRPDQVTPGSSYRAYWRCRTCAWEWSTEVSKRALEGRSCPACAGQVVTPTNNLAVRRPAVAAEWHPTNNGDLRPEQFTPGSNYRAWWRCRTCDWEWLTTVVSRALEGAGCRGCAGRAATPTNNLAARFPAVAAEWHPTDNGPLRPEDVTPGSHQKVWWRCRTCGWKWQAAVANRALNGTGCQGCTGKAVTPANNLAVRFPAVAAEWHPTRNSVLRPQQVMPGSEREVWWLCSRCGYQWSTKVANRALRGTGCRTCAGRGATPTNNLISRFPAIAAEWHPTDNGPLRP